MRDLTENVCDNTQSYGPDNRTTYIIRELNSSEQYILEDMLYEAIYQRDEEHKLPRDIIKKPELSVYIEEWGRKGDICLVADVEGSIAGAVWTRIPAGESKGFGFVDVKTPELAISLFKEHRHKGIGKELMKAVIVLLKEKGYKQVSLSVEKDNYAAGMYQKFGFDIISDCEHDYIMLLKLKH